MGRNAEQYGNAMIRTGSRCPLPVLVMLLLLGALACATAAKTTSVSVGVGLPAPWGAVTIGTAVPIGYGW